MRLVLYLDGDRANSVRPLAETHGDGYHAAGSLELRIGTRMLGVQLRSTARGGGARWPEADGLEALHAWAAEHERETMPAHAAEVL